MFGGDRSLAKRGVEAFARRKWRRARDLLQDALAEGPLPTTGDYALGLLYWRGLGGDRDARAAAACFARAAEDGHAGAQTALGIVLAHAKGATRNLDEARELLRSAAGVGNPVAMTELAALSDAGEAKRWLTRAADAAYTPAMRALGEELMDDDPVEALAWLYTHAAATGDPNSVKRASALAQEMSADEIAQAQKAGRAYARNVREEMKRK